MEPYPYPIGKYPYLESKWVEVCESRLNVGLFAETVTRVASKSYDCGMKMHYESRNGTEAGTVIYENGIKVSHIKRNKGA